MLLPALELTASGRPKLLVGEVEHAVLEKVRPQAQHLPIPGEYKCLVCCQDQLLYRFRQTSNLRPAGEFQAA